MYYDDNANLSYESKLPLHPVYIIFCKDSKYFRLLPIFTPVFTFFLLSYDMIRRQQSQYVKQKTQFPVKHRVDTVCGYNGVKC